MPELLLQSTGELLSITLSENVTSIPLADVAFNEAIAERIHKDAAAYGRDLFDKTFHDAQTRTMLTNLPANERLLLVADDPRIAAIPWEYLRDQNNKLLASRLNFVRGIPESQRKGSFAFSGPLEIVAIPVSPIDEPRVLNVEGEWKNLVEAVTMTNPPKSFTLKRVRPPTRSQLERSLGRQCTSIVHFMGHSTNHAGKAFLAFEDARARSHLVDAADFTDSLNARVFLVVLNSCLSAVVAHTEFGNIAQTLAYRGVPYALGMQFVLPDDAALVLSSALYDFLLREHSVEEAVMRTRRALEEPGRLPRLHSGWLAGIPVLYTSLQAPASAIELTAGESIIQADPVQLEQACDLTALPQAQHFVGRADQVSEGLSRILNPHQRGFVLLHGLGGIGKTSLARALAERVSWHYGDRVLAYSFETFARLDANNQHVVNESFADRFCNRLARFYGLDPTDAARYPTTVALQQAIRQRRVHTRSLLVLDNIETLIDTQKHHPGAQALATFISQLSEGEGAILLTSRMFPPADWGDCEVIPLSGLSEEAGADLFLELLPEDHKHLTSTAARQALSHRVQGHPLSIRLLAGRFADETVIDLPSFLTNIDAELEAAEQATPSSPEDPERQKTLYACMDYSVRRLKPEQRKVLDAVSLFLAPFLPGFAAYVLNDEQHTPLHLQSLARLGLLTATFKTFQEGEIMLLELHSMLRWYIQNHLLAQDSTWQERYGEVYKQLARQSYQPKGGYDQSALMRYLVHQSLPDFEAALQYLPSAGRSSLAYHLAKPYLRLGQNRHALALYEQALEIDQELGDVQGVAITQGAIADVLMQLGKPKEALELHEQALRTLQGLEDVSGAAATQYWMADALYERGKPQEAMALYEKALQTHQELGDMRSVAVTQHAIADLMAELGQPHEAIALLKQVLQTEQELGEMREAAVTQHAMADAMVRLGQLQEAMVLYKQALHTYQELGDVRSETVVGHAIANVLRHLDKPQEALVLYEQALKTCQKLEDVQGVAMIQNAMANVLAQLGKLQEAMALYRQSVQTMQKLGNLRGVATGQNAMANLLVQLGKPQKAIALYEQALRTTKELGEVQGVAVTKANFSQLLLQQGEHRRAVWMMWEAYTSLRESGFSRDARGVQELLISIKGGYLGPAQFDMLWKQAISDSQPHWLREVQASSSSGQVRISREELNMVVANTITVMTVMPEKRDEWREIMSSRLQRAQHVNQVEDAEFLTAILAILNNQAPSLPEGHSYANEINSIQAGIAVGGQDEGEDTLPFDAELIPRSVAVLLGGPQEKMAYAQYLMTQATQATDEDLKALLNVIQLALFSTDLSQLGRDLHGVYREAWETIAASVEAGGVDPRLFEVIARKTLGILGPAADTRSEWRSNLVELLHQATAHGDRNLMALLEEVIGLLDADGNPAGLGVGLKGIYAKTWQAIIEGLSK